MNLLEMICKELGVEVGEEWEGEWVIDNPYTNYTKFKITETGLMDYREDYDSWFIGGSFLSDLIYGRLKPVWKPKEGDWYYMPHIDLVAIDLWDTKKWENTLYENIIYKKGLVFQTQEEATACAEEMLEAIKEG